MAQTDKQMSFTDAAIEFSTDGTSWTDCSGESNEVTFDGYELMTSDTHTGDSDKPLLTAGKKGSGTVTVKVLFIDDTGLQDTAETQYDADPSGDLYFRVFPKGKTVGYKQYQTAAGKVIKPPYAIAGAYGSADAIAVEVQIRCPYITPGTYSTT